eukprot:TRINITY_DN1703_c0_g1_i1.p1 TRINITY_DN1703_c0_g1~~TRINITY_DN1703_c0_g1_i1.p1  ORF type:complete len:1281 (-),score=121.11 TRINITY_DN1703_c0_g1_i1:5341-9183(-)
MPLKSDILSQNEKVCIIEAGCHLLLKKNDSIIRRLYSWVLGHIKEKEGSDEFISVKNDVALKVFVKAMQNLFHSNLKPATAPLQIVKTIFEDNEGFTERLLPEIASTMVRYLETYKAGYDFSEALTNFAKTFLNSERQLVLIWQALGSELSELMGEQNYKKVLQTINLIKFFLTAYDTSNEKFASKSKYLKPIFARILMSMGSLSNNLTIMENTIPGLKLIKEILLILEKEAQLESFGLMAEGIKKFVAFYAQFITFIMEGKYEKDEESWKFVEEAFSLATKNVVAIQVYIDPEREGTEWLTQLVQCIEEPAMPCEITVICIEGIISIYEEQKKGAMSYRYLQSCIQKESEIIAKLWDMIGQSPNDRKVVELIKRADNIMPVVLSSCVINKLLDEQITTKVSAINRFALFWKLAAEYFPTFIPFVTEPLCLFHMIDFLNHDHPLVRHSSKSWLAESTRRLERILDPIISRLLKNTFEESCNKDTGQLIYTSPYDTRIAIDAFKRLRSILLTNKTELMYFMMHNTASSELLELYSKEKARLLCDLVRDKSTYLQLLLFLSIKYIRGQAAEHLKSQFITENAAVNACGCEFLELLLTSVEPVDRAPEVANWVIKPLLHGLQNAFLSKDSVMQVEILKIVKLIQFKCVAQNKKYAENCLTIFLDPLYMGIVQNGLESEVSYVRSSYISYTKATLPLYTVFMGDKLELFITQIMKYLSSNLSKCTAMAGAKTAEEKLIANENDILQILGGVRSVIHHYFFEADLELDKESRVTLQKQVGLPSGKKAKACVELTRNRILATIGELFINAQKIWRQPRPFVIKNFKLSHTGILPFTNQSYSDTLNMYYKEKFSFELIAREFTSYQEGIIAIVLPIIEKHPDPVIKSILNVWLREHHRMNDEALRKIVRLSQLKAQLQIDMLVLLRVPIENIVSGVIHNLETTGDIKGKKPPAKGSPIELRYDVAYKEASVCLFLYSYLVYTYDWYQKEQKPEEKLKSLRSMWTNLVNLFKYGLFVVLQLFNRIMMVNRMPSTLCWLYDIMFIMGIKYDPREVTQQERKVRRSIEDVIAQLTTETATISASHVGAVGDDKFSLMFACNPSIYDLIDKTELNEEEKKMCNNEVEVLNLKIKRILPQFEKIIGRDSLHKGIKLIQGMLCYYYLRGFCFITMKAMLYELTQKMLSVTNKDKMSSVVCFYLSIKPIAYYCDGQLVPTDSTERRIIRGMCGRRIIQCTADQGRIYCFQKTNSGYIFVRGMQICYELRIIGLLRSESEEFKEMEAHPKLVACL